jgi:translation elongation factor EF-G
MTGGRGYFTMAFDHYEMVPQHLAQDIIEAKRREDEEKED